MSAADVRTRTTFNVDDWLIHTPKDILAKSFGVDISVFNTLPTSNPYITNATISSNNTIDHPFGELSGNLSYVYKASEVAPTEVPGGGGTIQIVDSTNFPVSKTIAASIVTLKPGALRELHWHPNAEEWLYFLSGNAKATAFVGNVRPTFLSSPSLFLLPRLLVLSKLTTTTFRPTHARSTSPPATPPSSPTTAATTSKTPPPTKRCNGSKSTKATAW